MPFYANLGLFCTPRRVDSRSPHPARKRLDRTGDFRILLVMKTLPVFLLAAVAFFAASDVAYGQTNRWVYVHEPSFVGSYSLVQLFPENEWQDSELYLVDFSFSCKVGTFYKTEWLIWHQSSVIAELDGFMDDFTNVDQTTYGRCYTWDAFPLSEWETELPSYYHKDFLNALNAL